MTDSTTPSSAKPARSTGAGPQANVLALHVLDLGRKKGKALDDLRRGRGKLVDEIAETIARVAAEPDNPSSAENVLPVVMLVERKRKRKKGL